jgi:hypothetical protein
MDSDDLQNSELLPDRYTPLQQTLIYDALSENSSFSHVLKSTSYLCLHKISDYCPGLRILDKHNRSLKVAVQRLNFYGPPLIHTYVFWIVTLCSLAGEYKFVLSSKTLPPNFASNFLLALTGFYPLFSSPPRN